MTGLSGDAVMPPASQVCRPAAVSPRMGRLIWAAGPQRVVALWLKSQLLFEPGQGTHLGWPTALAVEAWVTRSTRHCDALPPLRCTRRTPPCLEISCTVRLPTFFGSRSRAPPPAASPPPPRGSSASPTP